MNKLHVCLLNDSFPPIIDGVANTVSNYAAIISSGLGKATVVTPAYPDVDDSAFNFPVVRYPSTDITQKITGYRAGNPFDADTIHKLSLAGFDVIHSHCPVASMLLARVLHERIDAPLVFTYHSKFDVNIEGGTKIKLFQDKAKEFLADNIAAADEVWAVSRGAGENMRNLGYYGDYVVMPNGVSFAKGRVDDEAVSLVTADYDLPRGVPVYLYVGRLMWYKGVKITLDALKEVKAQGKDFRMVFVGSGLHADEIKAYTEELGLTDKVFFTGPVQDREVLRAWYTRGDLFLFPSTYDTNGLVVREAAACALASVLIKDSCAAEDITDGRNGFLIEENPASMAALLLKLGDDISFMKETGQHAQDEIYLSWDESVRRAYERYGIVIENYRMKPPVPLKEKKELNGSDSLVRTMGDTILALNRMQDMSEHLKFIMEKSLLDATIDIADESQRIKARFDELRRKPEDRDPPALSD